MGKHEICKSKTNRRKELKKCNKRQRFNPKFYKTLPDEIQKDKSLMKYWNMRFRLFKLFDQGIKLDKGKMTNYFLFYY